MPKLTFKLLHIIKNRLKILKTYQAKHLLNFKSKVCKP